jgi:heme exporter protein B
MKRGGTCWTAFVRSKRQEAACCSQPMTLQRGGSEISNSNWQVEILAIFRKEWLQEARTRSALYAAGLFSLVAVVAIAFASHEEKLTPSIAAGLLWITLLFAGLTSLSRTFIAEEEAGTADLLRLLARPHAVFWGKALFNLAQMVISAAGISVLFFVFTNLTLDHAPMYLVSILGGCSALAASVTLCGALVGRATNRSMLAAAIGIPLLLPLIALGIRSTDLCFGATHEASAVSAAIGLCAYALVVFAAGPWVFAAVWKR